MSVCLVQYHLQLFCNFSYFVHFQAEDLFYRLMMIYLFLTIIIIIIIMRQENSTVRHTSSP